MNIPKVRVWSAVLFFSMAVLCVLWAADNSNPSNQAEDNCNFDYHACFDACGARQAREGLDWDWFWSCADQCVKELEACKKRGNIAAIGTPPPKQNPSATPTPRPGPGGISGLPESNPTATPRPGPGKVSGLPKSHPSPTPSPSGPTLLDKHAKSTPTPTPNHHHGNPTPTPTPNHYHGGGNHSPTPFPIKGHQGHQ